MNRRVRCVQVAVVALGVLTASSALADKVAVLPFLNASAATSADLDAARGATQLAVAGLSHNLPTEAELLTAQMSSKDGVVDTGEEYRAAGRASTSDWTIVGHVEGHGATYRLELDVCQISSGRIESLAREITPAQASAQVGEMPPVTPPVGPPPPPPPPPAPVKHAYAEGHPFAVGVFASALSAFSRPADATGSAAAALMGLTGAYALPVPGLELRADFDWSIAGPGSIDADAGARYAIPIVPSARLFIGPEATLGGFFASGADKTPRFLLQGAAFAALGIGEHVQLELVGNVAYAAGSPSLGLAGGTVRGLVRF
jgi:hypothetical protein